MGRYMQKFEGVYGEETKRYLQYFGGDFNFLTSYFYLERTIVIGDISTWIPAM
jgi:hypothetical protein